MAKQPRKEMRERDAKRPKIASSNKTLSTRSELGAKKYKYGTGIRGRAIDSQVFENLCRRQCPQTEILGVLGVSKPTLENWVLQNYFDDDGNPMAFMDVWKDLASNGLAELRQIQFKQAQSNPTMAIWLGKQYLGQSDRVENNTMERIQVISDIPTTSKDDE